MVAWGTSKLFGIDKRFGYQTMCCYLSKRTYSSFTFFSNSSVCIEVLLNPCEISQTQGVRNTMLGSIHFTLKLF